MDAVVKGAQSVAEEENMEVHTEDREAQFVELWSFTPGCNWMDVVEIRFQAGEEGGKSHYGSTEVDNRTAESSSGCKSESQAQTKLQFGTATFQPETSLFEVFASTYIVCIL